MRADNAMPAETTVVSLSGGVPGMDRLDNRRSGERHMTLFRVGSFQLNGRRELCLIRNISAGGMMIRAYCDLQPGMDLTVELKSGQPIDGRVSWVRDEYSGVEFIEPVDVIDILASGQDGPKPRMPRIEAHSFAIIRDGGIQHRARLVDISQGGAKLACPEPLRDGAAIVVSVGGLEPIAGVVCWSDGTHVGISFNRLLPLGEMVEWLRANRDGTSLSA